MCEQQDMYISICEQQDLYIKMCLYNIKIAQLC